MVWLKTTTRAFGDSIDPGRVGVSTNDIGYKEMVEAIPVATSPIILMIMAMKIDSKLWTRHKICVWPFVVIGLLLELREETGVFLILLDICLNCFMLAFSRELDLLSQSSFIRYTTGSTHFLSKYYVILTNSFISLYAIGAVQPLRWDCTIEIVEELSIHTQLERLEVISAVKNIACWEKTKWFCVMCFLGIASFSGVTVLGLILTFIVMSIFEVLHTSDMLCGEQYDLKKGFRTPLDDGPVRLRLSKFVFLVSSGVGVVHKGTLHTRFHVTKGAPLQVGGEWFRPVHVNEKFNFVTYFGPPQMAEPKTGERVLVQVVDAENEISFISARVTMLEDTGPIVRMPITTPETSGSGIYRIKQIGRRMVRYVEDSEEEEDEICGNLIKQETREADLELVGLTGVNVRLEKVYMENSKRKNQTEFIGWKKPSPEITIHGPEEDYSSLGGVFQVFKHCGAGKTRSVIPAILRNQHEDQWICIAAPTNEICREMEKSLREEGFQITGLHIDRQPPGVTILSIQFLFKTAIEIGFDFPRNTTFIIDEAHSSSVECMTLIKMFRSLAPEKGWTVWEITATGKRVSDGAEMLMRDSNFHITDVDLPEQDWIKQLCKMATIEEALKIVVFLPSVRRIDEIADQLKAAAGRNPIQIVRFHQNTYKKNYQLAIKDVEMVTFVLTTNTSEVGMNFNADVVFDSREQFGYFVEDRWKNGGYYNVIGRTVRATKAQEVQRRGRVGRRKPGVYYGMLRNETEEQDLIYLKGCIEDVESDEIVRVLLHDDVVGMPFPRLLAAIGLMSKVHGRNLKCKMISPKGHYYTEETVLFNLEVDDEACRGKKVDVLGKVRYINGYDERDISMYEKLFQKIDALRNK